MELSDNDIKILSKYQRSFLKAKAGELPIVFSNDVALLKPIYNKLGYTLHSSNCAGCLKTMYSILGDAWENNKYRYKQYDGI